MNFGNILIVTLKLFAVIDILGSFPIIVGLKPKIGHVQSGKANIIAGIIIILFLFSWRKNLKSNWYRYCLFCSSGCICNFLACTRDDFKYRTF